MRHISRLCGFCAGTLAELSQVSPISEPAEILWLLTKSLRKLLVSRRGCFGIREFEAVGSAALRQPRQCNTGRKSIHLTEDDAPQKLYRQTNQTVQARNTQLKYGFSEIRL